jgi:hypothetical protein
LGADAVMPAAAQPFWVVLTAGCGGCNDLTITVARRFLLTPRSNYGDRPEGQSPLLQRSRRLEPQRDWYSLTVPVWNRSGRKDPTSTVAAPIFAHAAVQKWGQARRASPPCCKPFDGLRSRGTGTRCLSRRVTAAPAKTLPSRSPRRFWLTPRSSYGA